MLRRTTNRTARIAQRLRNAHPPLKLPRNLKTAATPLSIAVQVRSPQPDIGIAVRFKYACFRPRNPNQQSPKGRRKFHGANSRMHLRWSRRAAGHSQRALAENPEEGGADQSRRLRRLRHRSAYPERTLAEAIALAVHARP